MSQYSKNQRQPGTQVQPGPLRRTSFHWMMGCLFVSIVGAGVVGCGIDPESLQALQEVSLQRTQITNDFNSQTETPESSGKNSIENFQPQFPERTDPFHIGKNDQTIEEQSADSTHVRVIGFAKLGEQQAILRIGEDTKFVVVGDRIGDVEVLGISPPRVRMRKGNLTWDASMFQNESVSSSGLE